MVFRFLKYCKFKYDFEYKSIKYIEMYCFVFIKL